MATVNYYVMIRLFALIFASLGGWVGWVLAQPMGTGVAFGASSLGSIAGVVLGWWIARRLFA